MNVTKKTETTTEDDTGVRRSIDDFRNILSNCEATFGLESVPFEFACSTAVKNILACHEAGNKVIFIGNGGSAAIASHEALDFWKAAGIRAIAFNDPIQLTCLGNDCGFENVFVRPIEMFAKDGDLLIAISSSGKSANIVEASRTAKKMGCQVITLSGFSDQNPLRQLGHLNFYLRSDQYGPVEVGHLWIIHHFSDSLALHRRNTPMKPLLRRVPS